MSKFIDDEAVLSDHDDDDDVKSKKRRKKKARIESEDEDDCDVANSEDEKFIDDTEQVDQTSDVSPIHSSEEDLCSGDELILRESRGSRVTQVQDSENDFSDEDEEESADDSVHETSIANYRKKEVMLHPSGSVCKKSIDQYFKPSANKEIMVDCASKTMAPEKVMPFMAFARNKQISKNKSKISLGDHKEQVLPSVTEDKPEANWNFLKRASTLPPAKDLSTIPGVMRTKDGRMVYVMKDGQQVKMHEDH